MFVSTFMLYGGLNHIIFLCLTFFEGVKACSSVRFSLYSLADSASLEEGAALLNVVLSDEILLICCEMLFGNALMILSGWFELTLI